MVSRYGTISCYTPGGFFNLWKGVNNELPGRVGECLVARRQGMGLEGTAHGMGVNGTYWWYRSLCASYTRVWYGCISNQSALFEIPRRHQRIQCHRPIQPWVRYKAVSVIIQVPCGEDFSR